MSNELVLGYDYSTGVKRLNKAEYYRQELEADLYGEENEFEDV